VMDFDPNLPLEKIFKDPNHHIGVNGEYTAVRRSELTISDISSIKDLSKTVTKENFKDVVLMLGKLHFFKECSTRDVFNWLAVIAAKSGNETVIDEVNTINSLFFKNGPKL